MTSSSSHLDPGVFFFITLNIWISVTTLAKIYCTPTDREKPSLLLHYMIPKMIPALPPVAHHGTLLFLAAQANQPSHGTEAQHLLG